MKYNVRMVTVDPFPKFEINEFKSKYENKLDIYMKLNGDRLLLLKCDGDHKWDTISDKLQIIEKNFKDKKFSVVFLRDVDGPCAGKDIYYTHEDT